MITLYHGSSKVIKKPSLEYSRVDVDFGAGFYLTNDLEMVEKWACRKKPPIINEYTLDTNKLSIYEFGLDEEWLDFVIANRNGTFTKFPTKNYDVLMGATADDKLFATIDNYEKGYFTPDTAVKLLNCMKVGNQVCIKTQNGLNALQYQKSWSIDKERIPEIQRQIRLDRANVNDAMRNVLTEEKERKTKATSISSQMSNTQTTHISRFEIDGQLWKQRDAELSSIESKNKDETSPDLK